MLAATVELEEAGGQAYQNDHMGKIFTEGFSFVTLLRGVDRLIIFSIRPLGGFNTKRAHGEDNETIRSTKNSI